MGPHNTPEEIYFFGLLFRWNEDSQWEVGSSGALNVDYGQIIPVGNDANETTLNVTIQISFHDGRFLGTGDFFDLKAALVLGHVDYTWTEDGNLVWQYNDINGNPISLANISNVISSAKDPNLSDKRGFANRYGFQSKYGFHTRSGFQKRFGF